jgi:hypothetical protein
LIPNRDTSSSVAKKLILNLGFTYFILLHAWKGSFSQFELKMVDKGSYKRESDVLIKVAAILLKKHNL